MSELTEILRKEYQIKKKKKPIDFSMLMEMVEHLYDAIEPEVMGNLPLPPRGYVMTENEEVQDPTAEEEDTDNVEVIRRPIIKITELWGQPGENDRTIMEAMMKKVEGGTVEEKISSVNEFLKASPIPGQGDISEVMTYLIFLDTFASIISDYGASVSGFLFEAFLAALFGGTSIQVDSPEQVGAKGTLPIEDNQLWTQLRQCEEGESGDECEKWDLVPYSLKVLRQGGTVHGSFKNLVDFFLDRNPQRKSDSITYLIVIKEATKDKKGKLGEWTGVLNFYEFVLTRENFLSMIGVPAKRPVWGWVLKKPSEVTRYAAVTVNPETNKVPKKAFPPEMVGTPRYKHADGTPIEVKTKFTDEKNPEGILVYEPTGEVQDVVKGSAAKLYTPEEYDAVKAALGHEPDEKVGREAFMALSKVKGYGSKAKGGAQWSIGHGVYKDHLIGSINLDPDLLKQKAEEYTQSLNASIVAIFNALGALSDNINNYFIGGQKGAGAQAVKNAKELKDEVNNVIPEEAIEQREVAEGKEKDLTSEEDVIIIEIER